MLQNGRENNILLSFDESLNNKLEDNLDLKSSVSICFFLQHYTKDADGLCTRLIKPKLMEGTVAAQDEFSRSKGTLRSLHRPTGTMASRLRGTFCLFTATLTSQIHHPSLMHREHTQAASPLKLCYHLQPNGINQQGINLVSGNDCWASPALKVNLYHPLLLGLLSFYSMYPSDPVNYYSRTMEV